jgi:surface antigen
MWRAVAVLGLVLSLAACGGGAGLGERASVECAPYARSISGVRLSGDAADWWSEADGHYPRSSEPAPGSVLVFRRSSRLPAGHVSVVSRVVSGREILVDQANWVHDRIGQGDPVVDVSPGNDWSAVRVWWAPAGTLGMTRYPTYGFVGPAG